MGPSRKDVELHNFLLSTIKLMEWIEKDKLEKEGLKVVVNTLSYCLKSLLKKSY